MRIVVVTGLSGAGRTSALRALEDLGIPAIDNLPVGLLLQLPDHLAPRSTPSEDQDEAIAVGIDSRGLRDQGAFAAACDDLRSEGHSVDVLFLTAPEEVLIRRFSETRRRHPMGTVPGAIRREREALGPLMERATQTIDTEHLSSGELRRLVRDRFGHPGRIRVVLASFGFKSALPREADLVFDARGLENPYGHTRLRHRSGFHPDVADFVLQQPLATDLLDIFERHVRLQVPASVREGRSYLTVAIGCTGGQHRSVVLTEALAGRLREGEALASATVEIDVRHRDVDRSGDD